MNQGFLGSVRTIRPGVLRSCVMDTLHLVRTFGSGNSHMNHLRIMICALGASLLLVFLGGCNKALAPSFQAVGVRETSNDGERSTIDFLIKASNPNPDPIPLRQVQYRVQLDGVQVFEGVRSPESTLHTYSSHEFALPAVLDLESLSGSGLIEYRLIGTVQYIPPGRLSEVLFDAEIKVPEAVLDLTGTIDTGSE